MPYQYSNNLNMSFGSCANKINESPSRIVKKNCNINIVNYYAHAADIDVQENSLSICYSLPRLHPFSPEKKNETFFYLT